MKKARFFLLGVVVIFVALIFIPNSSDNLDSIRDEHRQNIEASQYYKLKGKTSKERKALKLPPNPYFEREFILNMNPRTGFPEPEKLVELQGKLKRLRASAKVPGESVEKAWIERGPNNVGGRTRAMLFDPTDAETKRVYSGGVSGGLWVNEDITNPDSVWSLIESVPGNMAVSSIAVDPNNDQIWYLGTGELYTSGAVTGNGLYKSSDAGQSWELIFDGRTGDISEGTNQFIIPGRFFIQDVIVRDDNGTSQVFIAVGASFYRDGTFYDDAQRNNQFLGNSDDYGVYRSTDSGGTWSKLVIQQTPEGNPTQPNDFELGADNTLWLSSTRNYYGDNGGAIFASTDGLGFDLVTQIADMERTEIEVSETNPDKLYVLAEKNNGKPIIYLTEDKFVSLSELSLPDDADNGIPADDFCRGQAFYDLVIEADPSDDDILYVGGIDFFRSTDAGQSWTQISKWSNNPGLNTLNVPLVHADQHAIIFRPGSSNEAIIGNDGGAFFASSLSTAGNDPDAIQVRNNNYNVTQFYHAAITPDETEEFFLGGTQDNGTPYFYLPSATEPSSSIDISGGDGGFCFVDQAGVDYLITNYVYNNIISLYNFNLSDWRTINRDNNGDGDFINPGALDSNLDILYMNGTRNSPQIYRYSNLLNIPDGGSADKTTLTNSLLTFDPTAFEVSPFTTSSTTLLVGTLDGKILKVTNANQSAPTWTDISSSAFLGSVSDIAFGLNEESIYVTFSNYGVDSVWYTEDGGGTWENKEGNLPDIPVKAIMANPGDLTEVILGTDLGVWRTSNFFDDQPSWSHSYNGMSDVKVTSFQYRSSDNAVLASTYGRGMFSGTFESDPNGDSDGDGFINSEDNCPSTFNPDQADMDGDGIGDVCDADVDGDGVTNSSDNCELTPNPLQEDLDGDGIGDICDSDVDGDLISNIDDNCPRIYNPSQLDLDYDGIGDDCDDNINIEIVVPTGISPNGDGINDTFDIKDFQTIYPEGKLKVFDQNGVLVFEMESYDNNWGGTNLETGERLPVGSYYFIVESGEPIKYFYPEAFVEQGWLYINY